jgi:hypothetical protein
MILKKMIGAGAIAGALGLSAIGLAGVANAASSGGGGGGGSSSSTSGDSGTWPPKSDVQWPPKQDNDGGGGSNEGGGGSPPSTPIVMPFGQPAPTKTAAPLTNQSANSSDESKPIVPVNAPPLGTATSIVLPAQ